MDDAQVMQSLNLFLLDNNIPADIQYVNVPRVPPFESLKYHMIKIYGVIVIYYESASGNFEIAIHGEFKQFLERCCKDIDLAVYKFKVNIVDHDSFDNVLVIVRDLMRIHQNCRIGK